MSPPILYSAGAQRVLYAFRGALSFSTVLTYFEGAEPEKIAAVICKRSIYRENRVFVARDFARKDKIVSRLLKVVETYFFFKMTAIVEFILALITTLSSKPIRFLVNSKKLKFP